ncbi:hypothetical protein ACSLGG_29425 (plasmid) [Bacillus mycoides]|uniref:hypothetical protein n=1 Tax=Bacillus mycoides TaxID=1405 RepID=UPI003F7536D1
MDKNKLRAVSQYQLFLLKGLSLFLVMVLLINLILGVILKSFDSSGGSIDIVTFVFAMIFGFYLFNSAFKFSIVNGVSRRTYLIASVVTVGIISLAWSILTGIMIIISNEIGRSTILYLSIYSNGFFAMFLWLFSTILVLVVLSWFITVLLYLLSKKAKWILLCVSISVGPIVMLIDVFVNEFISNIVRVLLLFLGITENTTSPYLSSLMLVMLSVVVIGVNWMFIRKVEAK